MTDLTLPLPESDTQVSEVAKLPDNPNNAAPPIELLWRFFCSLRLTLANLLLLFLGMIAGTFVNPNNDSLANIERAFAHKPAVLWAYRTFELYDLFHSWWFTLLLVSLALNLIACSIERLPRVHYLVKYPEKRLDQVKGLRLRTRPEATGTDVGAVAKQLEDQRWRVQVFDGGYVYAEKGRWARYGVWVVHLALLFIMGGGVFGRLTAFEGVAELPQNGGEVDSMMVRTPTGVSFRKKLVDLANGRGFLVRCDDFRLKEFEPGRPKAFESDLRLFEKLPDGSAGRELAHETINVNHPLRYGGLTFYQSSYRALDDSPRAKVTLLDRANGAARALTVAPGEPIDAAEGLRYAVVNYDADFAGQGPAVQVVRSEWQPGEPLPQDGSLPADAHTTSFWVFQKAPDFDRNNRPDRFSFRFGDLTQLYATGLQVARDPSTPWIYAGCFLLFAGIFIAFYASHKRVWARVADGQLQLGGAAHRNPEAFAREFGELCTSLQVTPPKGAAA